ncbi:MAG: winged helix-turn-helix domain-containing protein [Actinomycetota bacterium]|nr:winged helix-turn-helix domain-containing protein [Actinomycetota bacterium]
MASKSGRRPTPPLAQLFASATLPRLLAALFLHDRINVTQLVQNVGVSRAVVSRELARLDELGLLESKREGNIRWVSIIEHSEVAAALRTLALASYGPPAVVAGEFASIAGVERCFIYGSWASRNAGVRGALPRDVDVLLIGNPDRDKVFQAEARAESRLGREVNTRTLSEREWTSDADPFFAALKERPLFEVKPDDNRK